jgi:hypothetical protein
MTGTALFTQFDPFTRRLRRLCRSIGHIRPVCTLRPTIPLRPICLWWSLALWAVCSGTVCAGAAIRKWSVASRSRWTTTAVVAAIAPCGCACTGRAITVERSARSVAPWALLRRTAAFVAATITPAIGHAHCCTDVIGAGAVFGAVFECGQGGELVG